MFQAGKSLALAVLVTIFSQWGFAVTECIPTLPSAPGESMPGGTQPDETTALLIQQAGHVIVPMVQIAGNALQHPSVNVNCMSIHTRRIVAQVAVFTLGATLAMPIAVVVIDEVDTAGAGNSLAALTGVAVVAVIMGAAAILARIVRKNPEYCLDPIP